MYEKLRQRLEENYIVGCIKHKGDLQFYVMPIAWWILDYQSYDPSILEKDTFKFRDGVYVVSDEKITEYLSSIQADRVSLSELKYIKDNFTEEYSRITFFIDFDAKEYISGFPDVEAEMYLPDKTWKSKFDWYPENYIPTDLK
jgi:hypothetical protein